MILYNKEVRTFSAIPKTMTPVNGLQGWLKG